MKSMNGPAEEKAISYKRKGFVKWVCPKCSQRGRAELYIDRKTEQKWALACTNEECRLVRDIPLPSLSLS
jgi:hypothetical protein